MIKKVTILFICFVTVFLSSFSYADSLGRLFTSAQDRQKLDYIRNKPPEVVQPIEEITIELPVVEETIEDDTPKVDFDIKLKGIVYRKDGRSTAWINDGNTYEGNLETQFINIPEKNIDDSSVNIVMPDKETRIQLKVGDNYIPQTEDEQQDAIVEE